MNPWAPGGRHLGRPGDRGRAGVGAAWGEEKVWGGGKAWEAAEEGGADGVNAAKKSEVPFVFINR